VVSILERFGMFELFLLFWGLVIPSLPIQKVDTVKDMVVPRICKTRIDLKLDMKYQHQQCWVCSKTYDKPSCFGLFCGKLIASTGFWPVDLLPMLGKSPGGN